MVGRELTQEEIKERIEHQDVLLAINAILATKSGQIFFKYLFKHLGVGELPELGLENNLLLDKLGFFRAGNSIFKIVAEANFEAAGKLLAQIEKERYEDLLKELSSRENQV